MPLRIFIQYSIQWIMSVQDRILFNFTFKIKTLSFRQLCLYCLYLYIEEEKRNVLFFK